MFYTMNTFLMLENKKPNVFSFQIQCRKKLMWIEHLINLRLNKKLYKCCALIISIINKKSEKKNLKCLYWSHTKLLKNFIFWYICESSYKTPKWYNGVKHEKKKWFMTQKFHNNASRWIIGFKHRYQFIVFKLNICRL